MALRFFPATARNVQRDIQSSESRGRVQDGFASYQDHDGLRRHWLLHRRITAEDPRHVAEDWRLRGMVKEASHGRAGGTDASPKRALNRRSRASSREQYDIVQDFPRRIYLHV